MPPPFFSKGGPCGPPGRLSLHCCFRPERWSDAAHSLTAALRGASGEGPAGPSLCRFHQGESREGKKPKSSPPLRAFLPEPVKKAQPFYSAFGASGSAQLVVCTFSLPKQRKGDCAASVTEDKPRQNTSSGWLRPQGFTCSQRFTSSPQSSRVRKRSCQPSLSVMSA